jgi:hypothetical protein
LSPQWLSDLAALVRRDSVRVDLQLNLAIHSPVMAVAFARAARAALPAWAFTGLAIGNEPDLYRTQAWLGQERIPSTLATTRRTWPVGYKPAEYMNDYLAYARALRRAIPGVPLTAPDITYPSVTWVQQLLGLGALSPQAIAIHRYATATCRRNGVHPPTVLSFLSDRYTGGLASTLFGDIALAHAHRLPLRVTEMNSIVCGRKQIAESFATALWAPDALFEMLRAGVNGISWHIRPSLANAPFQLTSSGIVPLPELYGLAVFKQMLGPRPQLEHVQITGAPTTSDPTLKVWVVRSATGLRLLALNKGPTPTTIRFHDPSGRATGDLARLTAPTVQSSTGVTFAGQTIGSDGRWHGQRAERAVPDNHGVYEFQVPAYTGAVLTLP